MIKGIYKYTDLETGDVVYVGKDSHIDKHRRHGQHLQPSSYDEQPFNRVIQNNPTRYEYSVLCSGEYSDLQLNKLERLFIKIFNPKFNFTTGGDGGTGYKHTEEAKVKMSEARSRNDLDNDILAKEYFENKLSTYEIADKYNCGSTTVYNRLKKNGYQLRNKSESHLHNDLNDDVLVKEYYGNGLNISKIAEKYNTGVSTVYKLFKKKGHQLKDNCGNNTTGYYRVTKHKSKRYKQRFVWRYQYTKKGKRRVIVSVDIKKLEKKVKAEGLPWRKL